MGERETDLMGGKFSNYNATDGEMRVKTINDDVSYVNIYTDIDSLSFMVDKQVNICYIIPYSFSCADVREKKSLRNGIGRTVVVQPRAFYIWYEVLFAKRGNIRGGSLHALTVFQVREEADCFSQ